MNWSKEFHAFRQYLFAKTDNYFLYFYKRWWTHTYTDEECDKNDLRPFVQNSIEPIIFTRGNAP